MNKSIIFTFTLLGLVIASASASAQGFGEPSLENSVGTSSLNGLSLIDDTHPGSFSPGAGRIPRFSIIVYRDNAILLDSLTGSTWLFRISNADSRPRARWVPIPRTNYPVTARQRGPRDVKPTHPKKDELESFHPFRGDEED